jgi:hypothetical protein
MKATKDEIEMLCAALISARTTRDLLKKSPHCPRPFVERADMLAEDIEELAEELAEKPVTTNRARA